MRRPLALVAALAVAAVLLLGVGGASPAAAAPGSWLSRINTYRGQNGLGPLAEDPVSTSVAQNWTQAMGDSNTLSHNPQVGQQVTTPWTRLGENVGYGQDEATLFQAFVNSSGHRANLLGAFNAVGIGQVVAGGRLWTTHVFIATNAPLQPTVWTVTAAGRPYGGLWTATNTGTVSARAGAPNLGQLASPPNQPVVGMASTPTGGGYWLVAADGGIFAYGDARFFGSAGGFWLNRPIVAMAATPSGRGYWLAASDGGIFAFGDASFQGSTGSFPLNQPITGMSASPSGAGYWLVASDGGIFAFGEAGFYGSTGAYHLVSPITGITRSSSGGGYRMVAADGGIFSYGDAAFYGGLAGTGGQRVTAMATTASGRGYWLVRSDNTTASFGDAPPA